MKIEKCIKETFVVIGKEGSTKDGQGFIQKLWSDANSHLSFCFIASFAFVLQMHRAKPIPLILPSIICRNTSAPGFRICIYIFHSSLHDCERCGQKMTAEKSYRPMNLGID